MSSNESGGSQRHPHSQIIGLEEYDYRDNLQGENFLGEVIYENDDCYASLAEYPLSGVGELNVTLKKEGGSDGFADTIQTLARYVLSDFPIRCSSYNIFFYHLKNQIHAKIFPRFTASPLYMGYRITNVMDETSKKRIIETLRSEKYFG